MAYLYTLEQHNLHIREQLESHHDNNVSEFDAYLVTLEQAVINLNPLMWLSAVATYVTTTSGTSATDSEDVTGINDRGDVSFTVDGTLTYVSDLRNGNPGFDLTSANVYESVSSVDLTGDSLLTMVIETPASWTGLQTLFRNSQTDGSRYIYYSGTLQNYASSYDSNVSLNTSTFYLITHIIDRNAGTETFRIKEAGQTVVVDTQSVTTPVGSATPTIFNFSGATVPNHVFTGRSGGSILDDDITAVATLENYFINLYNL